jgi:predicted nucleic acid-binding protein
MSAKVFIDTNVLIYAKDRTSPSKQRAAAAWLTALGNAGAGVLSRQSLREYYSVTSRIPQHRELARREVADLTAWVPSDGGLDRLEEAWQIQDRYMLGFYDSLLLASALEARCSHFLSEDMQHELDVYGTKVISFLRLSPAEVLSK